MTNANPRRFSDHIARRMPAFCATLIGGLIAVFVNIPLTSPDDRIGNTGSVAVGSLIAALVLSRAWGILQGDAEQRARSYSRICTVIFVLVAVAAFLLQILGEISNTVRYVVPLAACVIIVSAALAPIIERRLTAIGSIWLAALLAVGVLTIGIALAVLEVGFTQAPTLSLPPPP